MKRRIIGVVAAVLLAAMGTIVLVAWVRGAEQRALAGEQTVEVLVVQEAVAKGTSVEQLAERVTAQKVPAKVRAEGAVTDLDDLSGKVAAVELVPGEQVVSGRFVDPTAPEVRGQVEVPDGLQEVTVSLEPQRALGGTVRAGDTVGVFSSFEPFDMTGPGGENLGKTPNTTHLILHKVLVTRVQADVGGTPPAAEDDPAAQAAPQPPLTSNVLVTLAVDAPSAERIVFTAEHGTLWLSAEPDAATEDGTTVQSRETIYE